MKEFLRLYMTCLISIAITLFYQHWKEKNDLEIEVLKYQLSIYKENEESLK